MMIVNNSNSVDLLPRVLKDSVKFNPTLQKEMEEEKRENKKINDYSRDKCEATSASTCG